jgi:hypothetical protein
MSSRVTKKPLSDEEMRLKKTQQLAHNAAYMREYRAKKKIANPGKVVTPKIKTSKKVSVVKAKAPKKVRVVKAKAPKKARVVKAKAPKKVRDQERMDWLSHKKIEKILILGAETVELNYKRFWLRDHNREYEVTPEMKKAESLFRCLDRKQNKEKKNRMMLLHQPPVVAPALNQDQAVPVLTQVVVAPATKRTALDELAQQYADDDDVIEGFNTNWRPNPAPCRFK